MAASHSPAAPHTLLLAHGAQVAATPRFQIIVFLLFNIQFKGKSNIFELDQPWSEPSWKIPNYARQDFALVTMKRTKSESSKSSNQWSCSVRKSLASEQWRQKCKLAS
ncbi:hypothetical protein L195_g033159 [Trifolium pratense]|uniref:Uncharacterized protein n=1 Tax=Trifolium pratense TaxID=57577 RepID=A0A2K3LF95_TRIPR|nr:hypothetical protein L195_g033159 [Trifolium pratense]